jgi:hypothetical protein
MTTRRIVSVLLVIGLVAAACSDSGGDDEVRATGSTTTSPEGPSEAVLAAVGEPTDRYADPAMWVCAGRPSDEVCTEDLATTVIAADGTTDVVDRPATDDAAADCFYVYPTVDLAPTPGNATLEDTTDMVAMVRQQAAQFSSSCRVFAPLYEQATIGTYGFGSGEPPDLSAEEFEVAYSQVLDAFRFYLHNHNDGRPIVLLGHSQGSHHLARLSAELFDTNPELADRLVMAGLIGAGGFAVNTPPGETSGGTFENLPLCSTLEETGCVVAYTTFNASSPPSDPGYTSAPEGFEPACVNPALVAHGDPTVSESTFDYPVMGFGALSTDLSTVGLGDITTDFVTYPAAYVASCASDGSQAWLEVGAADASDERPSIPIDDQRLEAIGLGLHLLDYQLFAGDLQTLVEAKIDALVGGAGE